MSHEQAVAKFGSRMEKIYKPNVTVYQRAEQLEKWRQSGSIAPTVQLDYLGVEIQTRLDIFKNETYKIGELLYEAKQICPHGEFQKWIKKNFKFSYETASVYMRVYKRCLGFPEIVDKLKASTLNELCNSKFPDTLRQKVFKELDAGYLDAGGSIDFGVKSLLEKYKNGEIDPDNPKLETIFPHARLRSSMEVYIKHLKNCHNELTKWMNTFEDLKYTITLEIGGEPIEPDPDENPIIALMECKSKIFSIMDLYETQKDQVIDKLYKELFPVPVQSEGELVVLPKETEGQED